MTTATIEPAIAEATRRRAFLDAIGARADLATQLLDKHIAEGDLDLAVRQAGEVLALRLVAERAPAPVVDVAAVTAVGQATWEHVRPIFDHRPQSQQEVEAIARLHRLIEAARKADPQRADEYLAAFAEVRDAFDAYVARFGLVPDPDPRYHRRLVRRGA
jgi:peptidoglycan/xylan/chitin deacetylase (PgdA/CDA1 family)